MIEVGRLIGVAVAVFLGVDLEEVILYVLAFSTLVDT
jgi:hypothetical protein